MIPALFLRLQCSPLGKMTDKEGLGTRLPKTLVYERTVRVKRISREHSNGNLRF
jgi:hypothetical protein